MGHAVEGKSAQRALNDFASAARAEGKTHQAVRALRSRVMRFLRYLDEYGYDLYRVGHREAAGYQRHLTETGRDDGGAYSPRTVASYVGAAGAFYAFLSSHKLVVCNPFAGMRKVRSIKTLPSGIPTEEQMARLLSVLSHFDQELTLKRRVRRYRLHVLAELLYATGIRITEAALLKVDDVDLEAGTIYVAHGKGGIPRTCILNGYAREVLELYITRARESLLTAWHDPTLLFGTSWERFGVFANEGWKEYGAMCDLPHLHSHLFRHAVGYHLLRAGCPLPYIQQVLGHRRLRNTEVYTKVDAEDLRLVLETYHPRGRAA